MEPHNMGRAQVVRATDKALFVILADGEEFWIPKSVIHDDSEVFEEDSEPGDLIVKTWWAEKNGHV